MVKEQQADHDPTASGLQGDGLLLFLARTCQL
jgi:hypothetical protein